MKQGLQVRVVLMCVLLLAFCFSFSSPADSTKPKRVSTLNDTWFIAGEPERHTVIDTSIYHIEEYNIAQRNGKEYMNLGNTGTAAFPLVFDLDRSTGFNAGYNQFDIYKYRKDSIRYYQVVRPYAELTMMIGLQKEQMFQGKFANQHKGLVYYGADFTRFSSQGFYQNQKIVSNAVNAYFIYNSKNKRWNVQADVLFNEAKAQENGGVQTDPFTGAFFQKKLVPVTTLTALNQYKQVDFYLTTSYSIGKKYFANGIDSSKPKVLLPVFKISHRFNVERNEFKFQDTSPDSVYYGDFFRHDTVFNNLGYYKFGNAVMLEYRPRKLTSDSTFIEKDFIAYAESGFDYYLLTQNQGKNNFGNMYVSGTFRSNYASPLKLLYKASAKYYLYGWNQNDLLIDGMAGYDFGKYGTITGNFTYQLKEAPYIYERYNYVAASWNYSLPKTKIMGVGGKYQNSKIGITADLNYYVADHLPVYPGQASPYITNNEENVFIAHAGNRNSVVGLHFDNDVWLTIPANDGYIKSVYPMLVTKSSIYYENHLFKRALWFALGVDVRYRLPNNAPYYAPYLGAFYPTYANLKTYPVADVFLNVKIRTVRVFLKVDNLSSLLGGKGYYSLYQYPAADFSFHAGVKWRFFE